MAAGAAALGMISGLVQTGVNYGLSRISTEEDRKANYYYNEMAAKQADQRTRALYNDFYSPSALLNQYQQAGLSPSMMFGGTPGQGGMSGAKGNGPAGPQTPYAPLSMLEAAQIGLIQAQSKNIEADTNKKVEETANIKQDKILKQLQQIWQEYTNSEKSPEVNITTYHYYNADENKYVSLYDIANECKTFKEFEDIAYKYAANDESIQADMKTAVGVKTLQDVYYNANKLERDINVLSQEGVSAEFNESLIKALKTEGFADKNAKAAIAQLDASIETANLTKEQKQSWNNIIERLRKTNSTMADIVVVISMILNQAASNWVSVTKKID